MGIRRQDNNKVGNSGQDDKVGIERQDDKVKSDNKRVAELAAKVSCTKA